MRRERQDRCRPVVELGALVVLCLLVGCGPTVGEDRALEPVDDAGDFGGDGYIDAGGDDTLHDGVDSPSGCVDTGCAEGELCSSEGVCVDLDPACEVVEGRSGGQRIALLIPTNAVLYFSDMKLAAILAAREFNASFSGLEIVVCSTGDFEERAPELLQHLAGELGVSAFVGPMVGSVVRDLHPMILAHRSLVVSPVAAAADISHLEDDSLIWRMATSNSLRGQAGADLALEFAGAEHGSIVVVFDVHQEFDVDRVEGARRRLAGTGASIVDLELNRWEQGIDDAFPSRIPPAVVLYVGDRAPEILDRVESRVAGGPRWVIHPGFSSIQDLTEVAERHDALGRITLVAQQRGLGGPAKDHFTQLFESAYRREASRNSTGHVYDAVWALALAGLSPPASERDGAGYAAGLRFVLDPDGHPRVLGDDVAGAAPRNFPWRLMGAGSRMDLDLETGDNFSGIWSWDVYPGAVYPRREYDGRVGAW